MFDINARDAWLKGGDTCLPTASPYARWKMKL